MSAHSLAYELECLVENKTSKRFETEEYYNVVNTFYASGSEKNQRKTFDFFKTLSKDELVSRANIISKLYSVLIKIEHNVAQNS